jgi:glutaminyl-peptide cyclotransferase
MSSPQRAWWAATGAALLSVTLGTCAGPAPSTETASPTAVTATAYATPAQLTETVRGAASTTAPKDTPADPGPPEFVAARAWEHLRQQVAIGPRPAGSPELDATRSYIRDELERIGIDVREQVFDAHTPIGTVRMVNLIGTLPGRRPESIAIGSHYDTKRFSDFRFVGASDGASSTAVLIEVGRALKQRQHAFTIELIFFDGEEAILRDWAGTDNTYGSRHYVETAAREGTLDDLEALILLDMVGDRNLNFKRESSSTMWLTDIVWATAARLGYGGEFVEERTAIEDDHYRFLEAGVPATNIIDLDYPPWHTSGDDLGQVSARSLEITGRVVLEALPSVEAYLIATP